MEDVNQREISKWFGILVDLGICLNLTLGWFLGFVFIKFMAF